MQTPTPQEAARELAAPALRDGYRLVALHEYQDAQGQPLFWRLRCKHPDGRKWIRPLYRDGESYRLGEPSFPDTGKPLYRLPDLLAQPDAEAWVVEGETCADTLVECGVLATTSGSADSAGSADWRPLAGRTVTIWPDHDDAGRRYADAVMDRLHALGCIVKRVDTVPLGLPEKGDAVDWRQRHPEATSGDLCALPLVSGSIPGPMLSSLPQVVMTPGHRVRPMAVDWLWNGWLAAGKLHLIGGQPGTGKTTIALALAATITTGGCWPDGTRAERGSVVIWSGEDDPADTLVPRLLVAGANMSRVHFVDGMRDDGGRYPFDPARDVNALNEAMAHIPDVRMLMVDPLVSAVAGDSHKNAEVRRGLQPLVDLALKQRCALLGVTHFSKGTMGRDPVERITGSLAFGALARVVMVAARQEADGDRPVRRILMRAKSNIGPDGGGFAYDLHQGALTDYPGVVASSVRWGDTIEGTAREVLADVERPEDHLNNDAGGFLRELLSYGGCSAKEIYRQAECVGFSRDAMKRAKRRIGAVAVKQGMEGGWGWRLPSKAGMASAEGSEGIAQIYPHSSLPSEEEALPSAWDSLPSTEARVETVVTSIPSDTREISSIGQDTSRTETSKDASPAFLQVGTLAETLTAQVFQEDEPCKDANLREWHACESSDQFRREATLGEWHSYDPQGEPCRDANFIGYGGDPVTIKTANPVSQSGGLTRTVTGQGFREDELRKAANLECGGLNQGQDHWEAEL